MTDSRPESPQRAPHLPPPPDLVLEPDLPPVDCPKPDLPPDEDLWIFGYGSLMWRPGFDHLEMRPARLFGYHRAFCVRSIRHRGTEARPGLVLGLDAGGSCVGRAIRVAASWRELVVDYLYRREMVTSVYAPKFAPVALDDGRRARALTFVVDRAHDQYCGKLDVEEAARVIARASGRGGPNRDYLAETVRHLDEFGITDGPLHRMLDLVRGMER